MTKREAVVTLSLLVTALGLGACGGDDDGETGTACPSDSSLTYESFGRDFFEEHCLACHGTGGPQTPKLETVAQIRENARRIEAVAAAGPKGVNTTMPLGGSVAVSEREKLGQWLACGAPD